MALQGEEFVVTINGADQGGRNWAKLIQPLDRGSYDVAIVLRKLQALRFAGPIGLQHYGIGGDARENLAQSMAGWRLLQRRNRLMNAFTYAAPTNLKEATSLLANKWGDTELLAGGTDLVTSLKQNLVTPQRVVSLKNIP